MSFAAPIAFALTFLAIPIIGLYILKVRMRRVPVSTNLFWRQVYEEKPPRSLWQNFRHWLSLLMQLILLMLLLLAIADPLLSWQKKQAIRTVLVIDPSASMQATDVGPNRFESARARAHALVKRMREQDQMAIVLASGTPEVLIGSTGHAPSLHQVIETMRCFDGPTQLAPAIQLAKNLVAGLPNGEVVVLTDGCLSSEEWEKLNSSAPVSLDVATESKGDDRAEKESSERADMLPVIRWETVGGKADNLGIIQFQGRRSFRDSIGYELLIAVHNASSNAAKCRLEITLDGDIVDLFPLELAPDEKWSRSIEKTSLDGGVLHAELTRIEPVDANLSADAINRLTVDDQAYGILPQRKKTKVLLITRGNLFIRKVFETNPLVELQIRNEVPTKWPECDLIVLHRILPPTLPPQDCLVVDPESDCDLWKVGETLETPIVEEQLSNSTLMANIRLDNVMVPTAKRLAFSKPVLSLASTGRGESLYASVQREVGRCLVLSANLEEGDLAFRTAFPILVSNALGWFARESGELTPSIATGSRLTTTYTDASKGKPDDLPTHSHLELLSPLGVPSKIPLGASVDPSKAAANEPNERRYTLGPLMERGVWRVQIPPIENASKNESESTAQVVRQVAVNLANERETDLRPLDGIDAHSETSLRVMPFWLRPIWFYLAFLAALFSALEWGLYQRRWIA